MLTDATGVIVDQRCSDADAPVFRKWGLWKSADWGEPMEGTNGIGTCLEDLRHVVVHRDEHFLARNIEMSCIASPVFGPDGEVVAALDVSSARTDQTRAINRLVSAMVVQIANQIEADLFRAAFPGARIVVTSGDAMGCAALLAVDDDDIAIGANREARRVFELGYGAPLRPRPTVDLLGGQRRSSGFRNAERAAVMRALARADGNVSAAARALGVSRATLYRRMRRLGIEKTLRS